MAGGSKSLLASLRFTEPVKFTIGSRNHVTQQKWSDSVINPEMRWLNASGAKTLAAEINNENFTSQCRNFGEDFTAMDGMENGCESGFINSQPSMAEFMTALPHINESFHRGSSMNGPVMPPTLCQLENGNQLHSAPAVCTATGQSPSPPTKHPGSGNGLNVSVPEYPWMKEKKTTRKQHQVFKTRSDLRVSCSSIIPFARHLTTQGTTAVSVKGERYWPRGADRETGINHPSCPSDRHHQSRPSPMESRCACLSAV
ncbi:uncharacterized protein LOC143231832 [Tachypleus tridentatus]|uniref:uncharacterized protein LOC143231832 n=1 Tax=Tachypleus tridentatus TaxID=6853 RepID=UPI003FD5D8F9